MSLIGKKVPEFKAQAFKKGEKDFITVTDKDLDEEFYQRLIPKMDNLKIIEILS